MAGEFYPWLGWPHVPPLLMWSHGQILKPYPPEPEDERFFGTSLQEILDQPPHPDPLAEVDWP